MKIFVLSLLALFALGSAQDCSEERVEACLENLLSLLGDTSEDEACRKLQTSIDCLRNAADECLEEEDEDVEEGLEQLEKILSDNCEQALGSAQDCSEERAEACFEHLHKSFFGVTSKDEDCGGLQAYIDCLRNAVDECLEEGDEDAEKRLKYWEKVFSEHCEQALGSAQDCSEERAEACFEKLLASVLGDTNEEEICGGLQASIDCLRNAADECLEEWDEDVEETLKQWEKIHSEHCEQGRAKDSSEERIEACFENLPSSFYGDTSEDEDCGELQVSIDCLRNAVDEYLEEEDEEDVDEILKELEKILSDNCEQGEVNEGNEMIKKCFEANEEYLYECIYEGKTYALTTLMDKDGEVNENELQCSMYSFISGCFVERLEEKCGDEVASIMKKEFDDFPAEIVEAREKAGNIDQSFFKLLDRKK